MSVAQAKARLVDAFEQFLDELTASPVPWNANPSLRKAAAQPATPAAPAAPAQRRPNIDVVMPKAALPKPKTSAPADLSEETRARAVKEGTEIAVKVAKVTGGTGGHFDEALRGQLALNRIPFDAEVLQRLTEVVAK